MGVGGGGYVYFWGFHHTIPLGHKVNVLGPKMNQLALELVVIEPKQNLDPEPENQYLKILLPFDFCLHTLAKVIYCVITVFIIIVQLGPSFKSQVQGLDQSGTLKCL